MRRLAALSGMPARLLALAVVLVAFARPAFAQGQGDTPPDRGDVSNPRGSSGGIIKPANAPATPGAEPITDPRAKSYVAPEYPADAKAQGLEGTVILELRIDAAGHVTKATVVQPAGHGF